MATNYLDTGDTGRAVSAESDGALFAGIFGAEKYVLENGSQLKAEVQSNNIVKISDGDAVMYGRHVRIPANDSALVTINNGHSGTNRIDLIVFRYTKDSTGKETVDLVVIQGEDSTGTATAPTAVDGNILTGAMQSDFPLYSVELNGINIVKVNPLFNVIGNISKLKEELTELNSNLLNVKADLAKANTKLDNESKNWEHIGTKTDKSRIYIDETKYKEIFCELRLYDQYLQITFPVKYINNIPTSIEKSFCTGGYQTSQYPGAWAELKTGKMGGAAHPYVYFYRGFVNGNAITNNYGICIWGR